MAKSGKREQQLQYAAIIGTLKRAYGALHSSPTLDDRREAQAHVQGILTGLLMAFSLPQVESFISEAIE